jgi:regulator of RNase E activity RraA
MRLFKSVSACAGTVVVCQPHTHEIALMGELSAAALKLKGVRGYLVDGGTRDVDMIVELGFPVFCSFATPADIGAPRARHDINFTRRLAAFEAAAERVKPV